MADTEGTVKRRWKKAMRKSMQVFQKPREQKGNPFWHRKEYSVCLINNFKYSNFKEL